MEGYQAFEHLSAATRTTLRCGHGRPKDICGECFPTETKIDRDREFDQTAKTEPPAAIGTHAERRVSPSILEFRNQELAAENIDLKKRLAVANERIAGFERLAAGLAAKIDEFERGFKAVTGKAAADFLTDQAADKTAVSDAAANATDLTRCWRPVWSRGEIAACMLDHDHTGDCSADRPAAEMPMDAPHEITIAAGKCTNFHCRFEGDHYGPCQIDRPRQANPGA